MQTRLTALLTRLSARYAESFFYLFWNGLNIAFGVAALYVLARFMSDMAANAVSTIASVILAYFVNNCLVFKTKISIRAFVKFMLMRAASIVFDFLGMWLLLHFGIWLIAAKLLTMTVNTLANYFLSKYFIFQKENPEVMTTVSDARLIAFASHGDQRGQMCVIEGEHAIPFSIQRIFYIYETSGEAVRGQHANRFTEFVLINVSGACRVRVADTAGAEKVFCLDEPHTGLYIPRMLWKDMYDFTPDAVLLVLASEHYNADEYLRDYDAFLKI